MFPAIGMVMILAAVVSESWFLIVPGLLLLAFGFGAYRMPIIRTASSLALDPGNGVLRWRATVGAGEIPLRSIIRIVRSKRPGVYEIQSFDGAPVAFWLGTRDASVRGFFDRVGQGSPWITMSDLYVKRHLWWSGLPRA